MAALTPPGTLSPVPESSMSSPGASSPRKRSLSRRSFEGLESLLRRTSRIKTLADAAGKRHYELHLSRMPSPRHKYYKRVLRLRS